MRCCCSAQETPSGKGRPLETHNSFLHRKAACQRTRSSSTSKRHRGDLVPCPAQHSPHLRWLCGAGRNRRRCPHRVRSCWGTAVPAPHTACRREGTFPGRARGRLLPFGCAEPEGPKGFTASAEADSRRSTAEWRSPVQRTHRNPTSNSVCSLCQV